MTIYLTFTFHDGIIPAFSFPWQTRLSSATKSSGIICFPFDLLRSIKDAMIDGVSFSNLKGIYVG